MNESLPGAPIDGADPRAMALVTTDPAVGATVLGAGGLVGLPTETVYGLAADAGNADSIERVFAVKGRPSDHPLILHVGVDSVGSLVADGWLAPFADGAPALAQRARSTDGSARPPGAGTDRGTDDAQSWFSNLAGRYWPGPLTLIVPAGPRVLAVVTGGRPTVAVRVPAHPVAQAILHQFGSPVVAPSANRFGKVSPTNARHVLADLGDDLVVGRDVIVDGGDAPVGLESTIVDIASGPTPQVLRHGSIPLVDIATALGRAVDEPSGPARASGMHDAHYAPRGLVRLAETRQEARNVSEAAAREGTVLDIVDRSHDPLDAARHLYRDLRRADDADVDGIVVVLPEPRGIGIAVRDRLRRAAIGSGHPNRVG